MSCPEQSAALLLTVAALVALTDFADKAPAASLVFPRRQQNKKGDKHMNLWESFIPNSRYHKISGRSR